MMKRGTKIPEEKEMLDEPDSRHWIGNGFRLIFVGTWFIALNIILVFVKNPITDLLTKTLLISVLSAIAQICFIISLASFLCAIYLKIGEVAVRKS